MRLTKKFSLLLCLFLLSVILSGCSSKTCDLCGKALNGENYGQNDGATLCDDCAMLQQNWHDYLESSNVPDNAPVDEPAGFEEPVIEEPVYEEDSPEPSIPDFEEFYAFDSHGWALAKLNGYYGWVDQDYNTVIDFAYDGAYEFDESDMALVKKGNYWGWIDRNNSVIIDFQYTDASCFNGDLASVCANKWGVLKRDGNYILDPVYDEVLFTNNYIEIKYKGKWGLANYSGQQLIQAKYESFVFDDYRIYAEYGSFYPYNWIPYTFSGECLIGNGIRGISFPKNGGSIAYSTYGDKFLLRVDESIKKLVDQGFHDASDFSSSGFSVVTEQMYSRESLVYDLNGTLRYIIPNTVDFRNPDYANEFYAAGPLYIIDLVTDEMTEWGSVEPVDGTNCIIVQDDDTELYGLYDGPELVETGYTEITYEGTSIYLRRGDTVTEYTPVY